jgi:hypothetical protein
MVIDANIGNNVTPVVFFDHHIGQYAIQDFPGLKAQEINVRLVNGHRNRHSQFYRFEVSGVNQTDGIAITQQSSPDDPLGLLAVLDDDTSVVGVGWDTILERTGLACGR